MKKKIFITGAVREYDSANPKAFTDEIEEYIKTNLVDSNNATFVKVYSIEGSKTELTVKFDFGTGRDIDADMISREMYRCFTGECSTFTAQNSIYWAMNFGPNYPMNVMFRIIDTIDAHKKNTSYYKADRYKNLEIEEDSYSLTVTLKY